MSERRLYGVGTNYAALQQRLARIKQEMKQRYNIEMESVDAIIHVLQSTGFTGEDFDSIAYNKSVSTEERYETPLLVNLTHHEAVFDQLIKHQGAYTNFKDTPQDPNPALRHRAYTELTMRRMSYGDTVLLQCAIAQAAAMGPDDRPSGNISNYWKGLHMRFAEMLNANRRVSELSQTLAMLKHSDALGAAEFAVNLLEAAGAACGYSITELVQIIDSLINRESAAPDSSRREYVVRVHDLYKDRAYLKINYAGTQEHLYRIAVLCLILAIDCTVSPQLADVDGSDNPTGMLQKLLNVMFTCSNTHKPISRFTDNFMANYNSQFTDK